MSYLQVLKLGDVKPADSNAITVFDIDNIRSRGWGRFLLKDAIGKGLNHGIAICR